MKRHFAIAATALCCGLMPATAHAQSDASDRVNMVNIYGADDCPPSTGETITVCARYPESERYRIPRNLRESNSPDNESWTRRAQSLEAVGRFGPLSCSPAGAGGELGCTAQMIQQAYEEREQGADIRFSQLINDARQERLAEIDGEAAATQARVEELERAYMERLEAERDAELPSEAEPAQADVVAPEDMPDAGVRPPDFGDNDS